MFTLAALYSQDPQSVCQLLKMCTTAQIPKLSIVSLGSKVTSVQAIAPKPVESSPVCALCEFVLEKLEGLITSNATEVCIEKNRSLL